LIIPLSVLATTLAFEAFAENRFSRSAYWVFGLLTFVRIDTVLLAIACGLSLAWFDHRRRRQHLASMLIPAGCLAVQTGVRLWYYGEWLPNTYYLKMTGYPITWRIAWGLRRTAGFVWHHGPLFFAAAAVFAIRRRTAAILTLTAVVCAGFAYQIYTGSNDNRFMVVVMPFALVLVALAVRWVTAAIVGIFPGRAHATSARTAAVFCVLIGVGFIVLNGRLLITGLPESIGEDRILPRLQVIEAITEPDARIAITRAGMSRYFLDRPQIDELGKTDGHIARLPMNPMFTRDVPYVAGHVKWDYAYSIGHLQPDVVAELWRAPEQATPYLKDYVSIDILGYETFLRRGSPRIRWQEVERIRAGK
jgi:hypothetical protein